MFFPGHGNTLLDVFDFDDLLGLYSARFGKERMLVLPYELLRDSPHRFLGGIENWLGLEHLEFGVERANPSLSPQELYWYPRLSTWVAAAIEKQGHRRGSRLYNWHISHLGRTGQLRPLAALLDKSRGWAAEETLPEWLDGFRGNAARLKERLRDNPYYADFAAEYFWDEP